MKNRAGWMFFAALALALVLAACSPQATAPGTETPEPTEEATEEPATEEPTEEPTEAEPTTEPTEEPTEAEPTEEAPAEVTNSVEVMDQALGDDATVVVPSATSDTAGWMVIHADDGGAPGPVIGFTAVSAGENNDISVEVDAEGVTETLYAMLHVDAGTEGEYEFPGDDVPARDEDDAVVVEPFTLEASAAEGGEAAATVTVANNRFTPAEIVVAPGTTVTWTYNGSGAHTVAAEDGSFASGNMGRGDSFSFTFEEPGEYPYYCQYHGGAGGLGMAGVVIVQAP